MKRKWIVYNLICPACGILLIVALWAVTAAIYNKPLILPDIGSTLIGFFGFFATGEFYAQIAMTFARSVACFALSYALAFGLALLSAYCKWFAQAIKPLILLLRATPVIAVILIVLVAFNSNVLPIVVGFLTIFPLIYSAFYKELTSERMAQNLQVCAVYHTRKQDTAQYLYIPALAHISLSQAETLLPLSVKVVISAEVLAYTRVGLGLAMRSAQMNVETNKLIAYAFVAVLLSVIAQLLVTLVKLVCRRFVKCR